jgi:hypothetical protein
MEQLTKPTMECLLDIMADIKASLDGCPSGKDGSQYECLVK